MPKVYFGAKGEAPIELTRSPDMLAVRRTGQPATAGDTARGSTRSGRSPARPSDAHLRGCTLVQRFPEAGVDIYRVPTTRGGATLASRKAALQAEPDVRFAGGVLVDPDTRSPVLYTENLFVKFADAADTAASRAVLQGRGLRIKDEPGYAVNAFFVEAPEGTGQAVFDIAEQLLQRDDVEFAHPELVRQRQTKAINPAQWHLQPSTVRGVVVDAHAHVAAAHALTLGEGVTIAVIDDGFDTGHPEFNLPGKLVAPRDVFNRSDDPRPQNDEENHGTACAGVACAAGLSAQGASGVAPAARLMPIRHVASLGSQAEAEAFRWAADQGADVISCSWGPPDGTWWNPEDPLHHEVVRMPPSTQLALQYAATRGRGGKGCVIFFAAGNGNESVDNDGYASHPLVLAVAACNDSSRRSVYSDTGRALFCAFPSGDSAWPEAGHPAPLTSGIWTTDRRGPVGYNPGRSAQGDRAGDYANDFSGTSSACPGAAGVAALVLAVNPTLQRDEVKAVLQSACDRIDPAGGAYDAQGHSRLYGHGRLNALRAVQLAQPQPPAQPQPQPQPPQPPRPQRPPRPPAPQAPPRAVTVTRRVDAPLPDLGTVRVTLNVAEAMPVSALQVALELRHSYIGDLVVTLHPPRALGVPAVVLHDRAGGGRKRLNQVFDADTTPALQALAGRSCRGRWTLSVRDSAAEDSGTLVGWGLRLLLAPTPASPPPPTRATARKRPAGRRTAFTPLPTKKAAAKTAAA